MATKPVTAKLRLCLELIAVLPEPIMLDRLRRLSVAELTVFRRMYGIQECRCKGRCQIQQFMLRTTAAMKLGKSRRLAARLAREMRKAQVSGAGGVDHIVGIQHFDGVEENGPRVQTSGGLLVKACQTPSVCRE